MNYSIWVTIMTWFASEVIFRPKLWRHRTLRVTYASIRRQGSDSRGKAPERCTNMTILSNIHVPTIQDLPVLYTPLHGASAKQLRMQAI